MSDLLSDLHARGLIAQSTDLGALHEEMAKGPLTLYCGFDPTAPSLHLGNLAQIILIRRFQDVGHRVARPCANQPVCIPAVLDKQ